MLFSNFLCLLYLMVLVDSHIISKSIINKHKEIDVTNDNFNDYESTTHRIYPHEKFLHKHRRSKIEYTTKPVPIQQKTKEIIKHIKKTTKIDPLKLHLRPVHKSTKRRIGGFWRKFKIKGRHEDIDREKRLRHYLDKLSMSQAVTTFDDYPKMDLLQLENNKKQVSLKQKRDAVSINHFENTIVPTLLNNEKTHLTKDEFIIKPHEKSTISSTPSYRPYKSDADDLKKILSGISTKVAHVENTNNLNNNYFKNTSPSVSSYGKYINTIQATSPTIDEMELLGTAQIEALLNSIKEKAIQMIAEQNPAVTDIITNTVTEATFEADPILNHIEIVNPDYALSTFFSIKNITYDKRTPNSTESYKDETTKRYTQYHDIAVRSIKDEAMSVAQNVEEKLQKELKSIYKKVKNKVSCDLKKEMHDVKSTIKQKIDSTLKKAQTKIHNKTKKNTLATKFISNANKHSNTKSSVKISRDRNIINDDTKTKEVYRQTTADDYAMLNLFEQMLAKTHENNVLKTLTTIQKLTRKKRKENLHDSNQNTVALIDQTTEEDVNNNYDDSEDQLPEIYDYSIRVTIPDITTTMPQSNDNEKITTVDSETSGEDGEETNELKIEDTTEGIKERKDEIKPSSSDEYLTQFSNNTQSTDRTSFEDTSFENLSNKISYNEYVNGYKHYLNFQKDQANQNFSNLVKYQAHRHHSVDDIGKYILNKIPELPQLPKRDKRFFDDSDIDDQDISTKSDDSWFKKHFYMFVDNGPPRKFHTSQTVSLKSPITENIREITEIDTGTSLTKGNFNHMTSREEMEINLDELTNNLLNEETSTGLLPLRHRVTNSDTTQVIQNGKLMEITPDLKEFRPRLFSKFFGKARRTLKSLNSLITDVTERSSSELKGLNKSDEAGNDFLWKTDLNRYKRNQNKISTNIIKLKEKQGTTKTSHTDKKHGIVDINIVPKTASSTEHTKLSHKVDFIKKLINLLPFEKHKNGTSKRAKREPRVQRYNPLKKIRDYFISKPEDKLFKTNLNIPDYEIMKSHLDTFKPIKYNKILTVEEMKKQIPNISDDTETVSSKINNIENKKYMYQPIKEPIEGHLPSMMGNFEVRNNFRTYTKKFNVTNLATRYQNAFSDTDDVLKVNVKTLATIGYHGDNMLASTTNMKIDDIKNEIDTMRDKISPQDHDNNFLMKVPKTTSNVLELKPKKSQFNNYQTSTRLTKSLDGPKPMDTNYSFENNKIGRLYNTNNFIRNDKAYYSTNEYTKQDSTKITQKPSTKRKSKINDATKTEQMHYNNFYNDLLMWHKDILQSDKVPTPWQDILEAITPHNEYTPPNLEALQKELTEVTNTLDQYKASVPDKKATNKNDVLKEITSGNKNFIIQEETFRINKNIKKSGRIRDIDQGVNNFKDATYHPMTQEAIVDLSNEDKRNHDDQSIIYFDTTLLAYDDDVNYIMNKLTPRKLSRNSLTTPGRKLKSDSAQALTKINEQPLQYFSTPLPMSTNDFERFLKENSLDVASVTSPLTLPTVPTDHLSNLKSNSHTTPQKKINNKDLTKNKLPIAYNNKVVQTNTINDFDMNTDEFDYLDELHNELYNNYYYDKDRFKRYNEASNYYNDGFNNEGYKFTNTDTNLSEIEKKISIYKTKFASNPIAGLNEFMNAAYLPQRDIQVTVINFDDMDNKIENNTEATVSNLHADIDFRNPNKYTITTKSQTTEPASVTSKSIRHATSSSIYFDNLEKPTKDEEFFNKIHNDLLYNHIKTKKSTVKTFSENSDVNLGKTVQLPVDVLKEIHLKNGNKPKRVRISGQSYKYDIIYHHPEKKGSSQVPYLETSREKDFISTENWKPPSFNSDADADGEAITEQHQKRRFIINGNNLITTFEKHNEEKKENRVDNRKIDSKTVTEDVTSVYFDYGAPKSFTSQSYTNKVALNKRDLSGQTIYTAKDVAALEVIIDLLKNTLNTEEKHDINTKPDSCTSSHVINSQAINENPQTIPNSIQLHIAIPCEINDRKRSLGPVRVRKVFSARLSSPVDLEYQVHSFEAAPTTSITTTKEGLSPGIYLVIDDSKIPKAIVLKPVKTDLTSLYKRHSEIKMNAEKTVTKNPTKGLVKITLSKDLSSLISKRFALYSDVTEQNKMSRSIKSKEKNKVDNNRSKRGFNWDYVKKYLESDRVCNCKCKANKTMCRACAASDAVINELIFEFDNLAKYMNDHCTEIQTYFRMNPSGGKKLRDSVHKIDKSLKDYFKRVKGKCRGRTCKTFATYMDKRESAIQNGTEKNFGLNFISSLETLATDTETVSKLATFFDTKLRQKRDELFSAINNYICDENYDKRAHKEKRIVKNVYSLDNVNVNIICNTDSTTVDANKNNYLNPDAVTQSGWNYENNTKINVEQGKFKKLFSFGRKSKIDKKIVNKNKTAKDKREVTEVQIECPLITDTGGSFWYDYINKRSTEPKIKNSDIPDIKISVIQTQNFDSSTIGAQNDVDTYQNLEIVSTIANQEPSIPKMWLKDDQQNTSQSVVSKISDFFKILDNFNITNKTTDVNTEKIIFKHKNLTTKSKKTKNLHDKIISYIKTTKKPNRSMKSKINSHTKDTFKNVSNSIVETKTTTVSTKTPLKVIEKTKPSNSDLEMITYSINGDSYDKVNTSTEETFYDAGNYIVNKTPNTKTTNNKATDLKSTLIVFNKHVTSEATTETNPTILILSDYTNEPEKYKNLLLSIIEHETNKLNNEWLKYAYVGNVADNTDTGEMRRPQRLLKHLKRTDRRTTKQFKHVTEDNTCKVSESGDGLLKKIFSKLSMKVMGEQKATEINAHETKVRLGNKKISQEKRTSAYKEVYDSTRIPQRLCDLKATFKHILRIYKRSKRAVFEIYVRNITCYKYKNAPRSIFINNNKNRTLNRIKQCNNKHRQRITRHLSDTYLRKNNIKLNYFENNNLEVDAEQFEVEDTRGFETFYKGDDNIYRYYKRKRRDAQESDIARKLRKLPPIPTNLKEINVIDGDTVTLSCFGGNLPVTDEDQCTWKAEREDMLDHDNVMIDATTVTIRDVKAKNEGYYKCNEGTGLQEIFKVSVFALPTINIIHTVVYLMDSVCTHQDLKMLKLMGSKLSEVACFDECAGDAQEPICLRDNSDDVKACVGVKVTLTPNPGPRVNCSVQCRRDIQAAVASLLMDNVLALSSVQVVLHDNSVDKLLTPSIQQKNNFSTRASSKKGLRREHKMNSSISIGTTIMLSCPAGYRLLEDLKVCSPCPLNAYSREGDNKCFACPRGSSSEAGADSCLRLDRRRTRLSDWWWYPPCGYCVAFGVVLCCCGVCAAFAFIVHVTSRGCRPRDHEKPVATRNRKETLARKHRHSPSRVILSKFFKISLTSSMATDSQERKFEEWKERNVPPPLPPVDFDIFDSQTSKFSVSDVPNLN